jgi:AcrR family transcriptional regulator
MRRARVVRVMTALACEHGFAGVSVATVCSRAKISGRAFYELFDSRENCFLEALDEGYRRVVGVALAAIADADDWLDGARRALADLLLFFDSEPELTRVCLVETLTTGPRALERRQLLVGSFVDALVERSGALAPPEPHSLANTGIVASVVAVIADHLLTRDPKPLVGLLGPLMGIVAAPYLDGEAVRAEVRRAETVAAELLERLAAEGSSSSPAVDVPGALRDPRAWRMRQCLDHIADHRGASNRQVATAIGMESHTQMSTLLSRLERLGLARKRAGGPGRPNAWWLTSEGVDVNVRCTASIVAARRKHKSHLEIPLQTVV